MGFRLCYDHPERVAAFLCLGPHPYLRFKPHMLAGIPQLWFQPVVATPRLAPWALRADWLARHLLAGGTTTGDSITAEDLAVFVSRLHAEGHPEAGSALYRNLILPEMGRFASGTYRKRRLTVPTVSLMGAVSPAPALACSASTATRRTTSSATSSTAPRISSPMIVPMPS